MKRNILLIIVSATLAAIRSYHTIKDILSRFSGDTFVAQCVSAGNECIYHQQSAVGATPLLLQQENRTLNVTHLRCYLEDLDSPTQRLRTALRTYRRQIG